MKKPAIGRISEMLPMLFLLLIVACGPVEETAMGSTGGEESTSGTSEVQGLASELESSSPEASAAVPTVSTDLARVTESEALADPPELDANGIEVGFTEDGYPYRGDPAAPVVIEEFSDFQCPFCSRFFNESLPAIEENQIANGEVLLIFHDFPLSSIHPQAIDAANAARCAGEQDAAAFWGMHDLIFANLEQWSNSSPHLVFAEYAETLDLAMEQFTECLGSEKYVNEIQADYELGRSRGVNSTPSFFINGQPLIGAQPLTIFNQAIAAVKDGEQIAGSRDQAPAPGQPAPRPTPATVSMQQVAGSLGEDNAPVTIVEFTDYQCPFCQRHNAETLPQLIGNLVESGRVQYIIKDFPLEQIHPEARAAAAAARCAGEQNAYWPMHDALFAAQGEWGGQGSSAAAVMAGLATDLGLDADAFRDCLSSGRHDAAVQADLDEGIALGVRGTPYFFVNGFPINGAQPYALFEYAVGLAEEGTLAEAYSPPPEQEQTQPPPPSGPVDVPVDGSYSIGNPDAPVTIVEFTDYQCPFCQRHFEQTFPRLKANYIDQGIVRYVFKDFPLTTIHPQAVLAAEAARCAGEQGKYLEMHDLLFSNQDEWSNRGDADSIFLGYASELDFDTTAFNDCLDNHIYQDAVMADFEEGMGFGVSGTPAFFFNGHFLSGAQPYSIFERAIASLLSE